MRKIIGTLLAFGLGYITASNDLFPYILQEKSVLYIMSGLCASFVLIYIPLESIAEKESIENPLTCLRTSAREHLQRRGSF